MANQNGWKKIIERWESQKIQTSLIWWIDRLSQDGFKFKPYIGQFGAIILAFGTTIYAHAYSHDNLTRVLYSSSSQKMPHTDSSSANELDEQREKIMDILKKMPSGFKGYAITNGYLSIPDGKDLTIKKASEFLDFLESDEYEAIIRDFVFDK